MPELPEVEVTVRDLRKKVLGRTFIDMWSDFDKMLKIPENPKEFKREIKGKKILNIWRKGKNIIFDLSGGKHLLIHQKLTGHLLYGKWKKKNDEWKAVCVESPELTDPQNKYIHLVFSLNNGKQIALSDLRKFAKAELWQKEQFGQAKGIKELGSDPLSREFTFEVFKEGVKNKRGRIKQVLMDQKTISGIGNIYSDEILWKARVHPFKTASSLAQKELKAIYDNIAPVLLDAIRSKGSTISSGAEEYRRVDGKAGKYQSEHNVYRREGQACPSCEGKIERVKIGQRSWHFCPRCQKRP